MATLADVAREAGVSKATASRALTRPDMVAAATRERVTAAAGRLGFHANRSARALTTGRTGMVGLVVPTLANPFFAPLVLGAQRAAEEADAHVLLSVSEYDPGREAALTDRLGEQADGVVMVAPVGSDAELRERARRSPVVLVDRRVGRLPAVVLDTAAGAAEMVGHLLELGHRRLAYVAGPPGSWADEGRRAAMTERVAAAGARLTVLGPVTPTFDTGIATAAEVPHEVTAVLAFNSLVTLGLLHGLRAAGRRVPEDVSVAAGDDLTALGATDPAVTALEVPVEEAGAVAVQRLLELCAGAAGRSTTLTTRTVLRASTAAPRRA
ncbi:LacI family DNA-binding transcriptional regulator [Streptomyces sp. NPDC059740]|uniref:LacI family DNA-binding transcriptional regulator n=1 Tax=Streptomyces sp. NPDC059740 TaxID=3346926 RepID=UPI00364DE555